MTAKRKAKAAKPVRFEATVQSTRAGDILRLPDAASKQLPSRGQVAVEGTLNGHAFDTVIEPDGEFGHWMRVDGSLKKAASAGDEATVEVQPAEEWPEPRVPKDLKKALSGAPKEIRDLWKAGPLGQRNEERRHPRAAGRGEHLQAQQRQAPPLLLQPRVMHRPRAGAKRQARPRLSDESPGYPP